MKLAPLAAGMAAALVATCTAAPPPSQDQRPVIVIASELPMTGVLNTDVLPLRAAIQLAVSDRGTIDGYRLAYRPYDDALVGMFEPIKGEQNARAMVEQPQILGVVGPYNSGVAAVEIPITNEAGLVMVSPSNTYDCLTAQSAPCTRRPSGVNNYFRIAASYSAEAKAAALFAVRRLNLTRFAVLTDGGDNGALMADSFTAQLTAHSGTVVFRQTYAPNAMDFTPLLDDAFGAGAQAIFVGADSNPCPVRAGMVSMGRQDAYMLAGDYVADPPCAAEAGADDHLLAMISEAEPAPTSKIWQEFRAHGIQAGEYAFAAYDCAEIIIAAIGQAIQANGGKLPTRLQVLNAVAATHDFVGTTGTFTFLPSGDAEAPAVSVYHINKGKWTFWQNAS